MVPMLTTWSLSGADRSKFDITGGTLIFMTGFTPNYEMPADDNMDNTYEVTVVATVGGMSGTRDVKVMVDQPGGSWNGHPEQDPAARRSVGHGYPDRSRREHIRPYLAVVPE